MVYAAEEAGVLRVAETERGYVRSHTDRGHRRYKLSYYVRLLIILRGLGGGDGQMFRGKVWMFRSRRAWLSSAARARSLPPATITLNLSTHPPSLYSERLTTS